MKVTFLLPGRPLQPVGGYRVVYEYANGLASRGHDVEIAHPARLRQHRNFPPLHPVAFGKYVRGQTAFRFDQLRRRDRALTWFALHPDVRLTFPPTLSPRHVRHGDAYVATAWETAEYAARLTLEHGTGFYLIQHHETWSGAPQRVDNTWRLPLHKIVIADWLLKRAHSLGLDDVIHIPNAIDLKSFRTTESLERRPPRVAMLYSTWHLWKGTSTGIEALQLAKQEVPDLEARLFGVNPPPDSVPDWIECFQDPSQRTLVEEIYNGSRVYLCPSVAEGWHLPPAEAMACGCALVSTDIGGVRDYARPGENALLSPVGDPQSLAKNIVRLMRDDAERMRLARNAVKTIQEFSWSRSVQAFERYLLDKVSEERARR